MSGTRFRIGPTCGLILSVVLFNGAIASAQTWTGGGADDLWSDGVNWSSNPNPPVNNGTAPILFAGTTRLTPDVDTPYDIQSLSFASGAGSFILHDDALTIEAGGVTNNSTNTETINNAVVVNATQTWTAAAGNLVFGSTVNLNGNILTIDGPDNTTISGAISDSAGGGGLTKNGAGTLFLNAANTFTGPVTLNAGTMQAGATNAFPDVAYTITGGTLNFNGFNSNLGAVTNSGGAITLNGATTTIASLNQSGAGSLTTGAGVAHITGALTLNGNSSFDVSNGGTATAGSLTGSSSTANLNLGANGTFTDTTTGTDTYAGAITSSGGTFIMNGTGNLTLSNGNNVNTFGSGNVTITQGTITAGVANSLPVANYSVDGTLNVNNTTVTALELTSTGTSGQITLGTGTLNIADTGTFVYGGGVSGGTGSSIAMEAGTQTINGVVGGQTAITGNGGTLTLGGTNTYTGGTTLNSGSTVSISSDANIGGASSAITFNGGTLEVTGTALTSLATTHTINTATFNGGFDIDNGANTFTVSQNLSGTGSLSKSGDGTLLLSGTNTYSGGTTVTDGTLQGSTTNIQDNITATSPGTVNFNQSANGTYSGAISGTGNVTIDANTSTVTFTGSNAYSGVTTIDSGTLQIGNGGTTGALGTGAVTDNGTLAFDQTDSVTAANNIGGTGGVTQKGTGLLTLSGTSNYSGPTTVSTGQLNVDGTIASPTTVAAGATLGGVGTITNTVSNSGTLTPGNAANKTGTLNVTGTYTFAAPGTTMNVSVNDSAAQNVSQLAVTGNTQLDSSKLHVDLSSGNFDKTGTTHYTFLTSSSGIGGSFASAASTSDFVKVNLTQEADDVFFTLTQNFAGPGKTFNQIQAGNYLTANAANTNTDFQAVINALTAITSPAGARVALTQISGDIHPTLAQMNVNNTSLVIGDIASRLRAGPFAPGGALAVADNKSSGGLGAPIALVSEGPDGEPEIQSCPQNCSPQWTAWGMGYGMGGSADSDGNATGATFGMGGVVAGLERWEDDCHLIGFYGAYVGANVGTENGQDATINGGQIGAYVFADDGFNYYTLLGGFEADGDTTNRRVTVGTISSPNTSDYNDWQSFVYLERGVSFEECNYVLQPFVAAQYIFVRQNGFSETGGTNTALDLNGNSDSTNSLRSMVGARLQYAMVNHDGRRTLPEIHALWLHEYLDADSSVTATMVPIGGAPFTVRGLDMGRDWAVLGASFTWEMLDGWSMFVSYDLQTNTQMTLNAGTGGLGYRW